MSDTDSVNSTELLKPLGLPAELTAAELRGLAPLTPDQLERTASGPPPADPLGQQRAIGAVRLAIGIDAPGYNVFVSGSRTSQERGMVARLLEEKAATRPTPGDWVYVNNFRNSESPRAIYLEPGQGSELRAQMRELVEFVRDQLPKAFRQEAFDQERTALKEKFNRRTQELFGNFENLARERGFAIQNTPTGQVIFIPLIDGKMPESPEALSKAMQEMPEAERNRLAQVQSALHDELAKLLARQQEVMRELINDIRAVERAFAARLIEPSITMLGQRFNNPAVDSYLAEVSEHMLSHLDRFREPGPAGEGKEEGMPPILRAEDGAARMVEYEVNLLVDNSERTGAPVIREYSPTYRDLFGTIERWADPLGRSATNFTRIIPGSFLKAHGGYLMIDLEDAIVEPGVWKMLKRALKTGRLTPETYDPFPFFSVTGLKPEPIAVRTRLIAIGSPYLYNLLYFYDQDFAELFKVKAEIRPVIEAGAEAVGHYAAHLAELAKREHLPPFDGGALARIVEYGMRRAGERGRVLTLMEPIDDLAREAAYYAGTQAAAGSPAEITARDVERALSERVLRLNFIEEEIRRLIAERTLVVEVDGLRSGQINGLAVLDVGGYAFGRPSRVTATVALGQAGLINIERESRLSGSTHDKGIMILSGFLRWRFGQLHPIAMSASICFEQSYSGIDGDSASSTELYALLSALSGVPIRQDLAVTGSVDQYGHVQAIGGANEKIEGFYRVCKAVGLTGTQGVLLPRANLNNLLLDPEVTAAVEAGRFHLYPIDMVDRGIELLTGVRAGTLTEPGTINYLVDQRLTRMAEVLRGLGTHETRLIQEAAAAPAPPKPPGPPEPPR